ncbi:Uncharacterised protein [Klebsiella pneumoniae]|jgi:hypothetical protein|nr:Uncharacterised protein [Klebsiella pneumoniae]
MGTDNLSKVIADIVAATILFDIDPVILALFLFFG